MPESISDVENSFGKKVEVGRLLAVTLGLPILLAVFLAAITLSVYAQPLDFDFINYDGPIYTNSNAVVQNGFTISGVIWAFTEETDHARYWAPLTWITF